MASLNRCEFIGNLGKDPEVKTLPSGNKVANFSIACSESWKDKTTGEKKERTEWVNITVFSEGLVGVVSSYLKKGSKVYVAGKFQTRKWKHSDGNDRYSTEIVLQGFDAQIIMLDGRRDGEAAGQASESASSSRPQSEASAQSSNNNDDNIPF